MKKYLATLLIVVMAVSILSAAGAVTTTKAEAAAPIYRLTLQTNTQPIAGQGAVCYGILIKDGRPLAGSPVHIWQRYNGVWIGPMEKPGQGQGVTDGHGRYLFYVSYQRTQVGKIITWQARATVYGPPATVGSAHISIAPVNPTTVYSNIVQVKPTANTPISLQP